LWPSQHRNEQINTRNAAGTRNRGVKGKDQSGLSNDGTRTKYRNQADGNERKDMERSEKKIVTKGVELVEALRKIRGIAGMPPKEKGGKNGGR